MKVTWTVGEENGKAEMLWLNSTLANHFAKKKYAALRKTVDLNTRSCVADDSSGRLGAVLNGLLVIALLLWPLLLVISVASACVRQACAVIGSDLLAGEKMGARCRI